jgi:hypothetical protein
LAVSIVVATPHARAEDLNDYPTSARADYVFGCMKANGETQELLQKCSCSIDVIASIIPYDRYVAAETILSMSQVTGPVGSEFRSTEPARLALQEFRRAQAEAEVRCFWADFLWGRHRYSIDFSINHSSLNRCLLVSIASARKLAAPLGDQNQNHPKNDAHDAQCPPCTPIRVGMPYYRARQRASATRQFLAYHNSLTTEDR